MQTWWMGDRVDGAQCEHGVYTGRPGQTTSPPGIRRDPAFVGSKVPRGQDGDNPEPAAASAMAGLESYQEEELHPTSVGNMTPTRPWNLEAEPFHPYIGSMVRPLTQETPRPGNRYRRTLTPPPSSKGSDNKQAAGSGATTGGIPEAPRDPGEQYEYGTWHQPRVKKIQWGKNAERHEEKDSRIVDEARNVKFDTQPPEMIKLPPAETEGEETSEGEEDQKRVPEQHAKREKADWRSFGDGTKEWERCRTSWESYEKATENHLMDIELHTAWDNYQEKSPDEKLEEALCLHMHLANQREHLDRLTCEARDLVVVALAHYHTKAEKEEDEVMSRDKYIGEIKNRWNEPQGRQLRLLRNRWHDESPGWSINSFEMFQFNQIDKILGALVQLCMAKQMAPPWESNNHNRRKGGRAARRRNAALKTIEEKYPAGGAHTVF